MSALAPPAEFVLSAEPARHRFTVDDMWAMYETGVLAPDARVELIEGELVDMRDDGALHIDWSVALGRWLHGALDGAFAIVPGSTLRLSKANGPKPDWYVFPASIPTSDLRGKDVLLAIEQSKTSLRFDLGGKAKLYARHGLRDYWVIDMERRLLHRFRNPTATGYREKSTFEADRPVTALLVPGLTLRLADLPRVG